jgi:hypothetical protein
MTAKMQTEFHERFWGSFTGVLQWSDLDTLWAQVRGTAEGWYVYDLEEPPPAIPLPAARLNDFLSTLNALLRREHEYDYCGIVYVDDLDCPTLIKVYHPGHLGAVCGSSGDKVLPRWVLSRTRPTSMQERGRGNERLAWWQHWWKRG